MEKGTPGEMGNSVRLHYRALLNNSLSAIFFALSDGAILEANQTASEMFGYSIEEFRKLRRDAIIEHTDPVLSRLIAERKQKDRVKGEIVGIKKNGERFPIEFSSSLFRDEAGVEYTCNIMNDISERKMADRETNLMLNNTNEAFILLDKELNIISFNRQFHKLYRELYGYDIVKGAFILDYVQPGRKEMVHDIYKKVLTGVSEVLERVLPVSTEVSRTYSIRFHPAKDEQDEIIGVFGTVMDITLEKELGNKQLELNKQLQQRNSFIESILHYLPIGVAVNRIDDGKATLLNNQFSRIYGWAEEDLLDVESFFRKIYPDEPYRNKMVTQIMADIESRDLERMQWNNISITTHTGEKRIVNVRNIPMYDQNLMISTVLDVTREAQQAEEIKKANDTLNRIMNSSLDIICTITAEGVFRQVSKASEALWGYTAGELIGRKFTEFIYPEDLPKTEKQISQIMTGSNLTYIKNRYVHKSGRIVPMEWSATWDPKEQLRYAVGRDVTEKIQAEQALVESEQKYRNLFENNPAPMIIWDFKTKQILDCNQEALQKYGYTKAEFLGMTIKDIRPEEDIPELEKATRDETLYGNIHRRIWRHKKKSGELMLMDIKGHLINYRNRRASFVLLNDITEKVQAEERLIQSEAFLAEAQHLAKIGSWNFDFHLDKLTWSDELYNVFGTDKNTFLETHQSFVDLVDEADRELVLKTSHATQKTGEPFHIEYHVTTPSGEKRVIEERGYGEKDEEGKVIRLFGTAQDITGWKIAEQKIIEANQRYEYATKATFDAVWDMDLISGKVFWGENYYRIFGYMDDEQLTDIENVHKRIHPDELDIFRNSIRAVLQSDASNWELQHRFLKSDGSYAFVLNNGLVIRDETGKPTRAIGAMQDITKQKKEEQHLKLLESVITHTQDAVLITEAEPFDEPGPKIVYVNEAFTQMTGYTAEEVIGKTPRILQGPKSDRNELAKLSDAMRRWEPCEITTINYRKNGEEFWINFSLSPVANETGWYTHWIAIERDVSSRKQEELQNALFTHISYLFSNPVDLKEIFKGVLEAISRFAGIDASEVWITSTDQNKINLIAQYAKNEKSAIFFKETKNYWSLAKQEGLVGMAWDAATVQYWENLDQMEGFTRKHIAQESGLQSAWSVPIVYNQEIIGVLMFWLSAGFIPDRELPQLFNSLGSHIGAEVKRKQLEQELSRVFSLTPDIICIAGTDGYFKKVNPAFCRMLEYEEDELLNTPYLELVHPDDREITWQEEKNLLEGKPALLFEHRFLTKSGKYIWISWTANLMQEENLIFAAGKNITEGKQLQQLLDKATDLAQIGGWEIDLLKGSLFWSEMTKKIHEVDRDFVPDIETGIHFYKKEYRQRIRQAIEDAMSAGTAFDLELQIISALGNVKWVRVIGEAEFVNQKCIRVYGSIQDINAQKLSEITVTDTLREKDAILESIGDAFFTVDKNLKITYWNRMSETVFGKIRNEVIGLDVQTIYKETFDKEYFAYYKSALIKKTNQHFESRYEPMDAWHEVSIYPSNNGLSVYCKDITYRKKVEKEIQVSNERYNLAAKATSDIVWDWDLLKDEVIRSEDNIEKLMGYPREISSNRDFNWFNLIHPDDIERVKELMTNILSDKDQYFIDAEYRFKKANGEYAYLYDKGYVLRDASGKAIRLIGATQDITRIKENELQLKKRAEELAVSNLELEQFAFVASHDLQEPLRMITSFLTQLDKKYNNVLDEKAKKYIYFAVDGAKRMRQIILDLLQYSRVGRIENTMEELDLNELLREIVILLQKKIKDKNAEILTDPMPVIHSFRAPLRQVFQNLISNALKYSKEDSDVRVHISVTDNPDHWLFAVSDNGIGIHPDYFEKVFILFQRLHTKNEYSGTGIGLSVSKKIIENLGGKIWVESEEGKGSAFYFTLPK